jgi:glucuronoarabinoxylan endo-1,4-beta-xylanase
MKRTVYFLSALGGMVCLFIWGQAPPVHAQGTQKQEMRIFAGQPRQTVDGFGASLAYYEGWLNIHPNKDQIYNTIFGELSLDLLRVRNAFDYDAGMVGRVQEYMEKAEAIRGRPIPLLTTSWGPPGYLKNTGSRINGGTLRYTAGPEGVDFDYEGFAAWWAGAMDEYASHGIYPDYVSIQNEPGFVAETYESCILRPAEVVTSADTFAGYNRALEAVYDTLVKRDHVPKFVGPECVGIGYNNVESYINPLDLNRLHAIGHHLYHGANPSNPYASTDYAKVGDFHPEVPHWQTEFSLREVDWMDMAGLIYMSFHDEEATAYFYWDLIWNEPDGLVSLENPYFPGNWDYPLGFVTNKKFYVFKQFSAFVEPGWQRVELEIGGSDPKALAFVSPDRDSMACVVINTSETQPLSIRVGIDGYRIDGFSYVYETSGTRNCEKVSRVKDSVLTVQPLSVNTVEMQLIPYDPGTDTVAPTVPSNVRFTKIEPYSLSILWNPSSDSFGVAWYLVYLDEELHGTTRNTSYAFQDLETGTDYLVSVSAMDDAGNESELSQPILGSTLYVDTIRPVLEATDSVYQEGIIEVTSNEDGMIYLVPFNTPRWIDQIREAALDSLEARADSAVQFMITGLGNGTYWLYAIDSALNISDFEPFQVVGVGMQSPVIGPLGLYPNPVSGTASLQFALDREQLLWLVLLDSQGREVRRENLGHLSAGDHRQPFLRGGLQSGFYLLRIEGAGGRGRNLRVMISD